VSRPQRSPAGSGPPPTHSGPSATAPAPPGPAPAGLAVIDKPAGWTSHDVVARVRRLAATRRVGHAGTLDPLATGVLLVGVGAATRLLGYLSGSDKSYRATVVLGVATTTDDAEGEPTVRRPTAGLTDEQIRSAAAGLVGRIEQVPPAYSAVQQQGRRAYAAARAGQPLDLPPRQIEVHRLEVLAVRRAGDTVLADLDIDVSAGGYIRALARDLGRSLQVGGHLSALRRTRVGRYTLDRASPPEPPLALRPLDTVVAETFPRRDVDADTARRVAHGGRLPPGGSTEPVGVFGPAGRLLALVADRDGAAHPLVVFPEGAS
jgi:tRNA pseudouridine55 synthase